jgi:hypothetical protein
MGFGGVCGSDGRALVGATKEMGIRQQGAGNTEGKAEDQGGHWEVGRGETCRIRGEKSLGGKVASEDENNLKSLGRFFLKNRRLNLGREFF